MSRAIGKVAIEPEVDLLLSFVNTWDLESGEDAIADQAALRAWVEEKTGERLPELDEAEVASVRALRESLRALLGANNGRKIGEPELRPLREAAERSSYRVGLSPTGEVTLDCACTHLTAFEARLLLAIERLQSHGAWPRIKACSDEECQWAFYDSTRNRSRTWCSMEVCGNREKTRRYRQRKSSG